MADTNYIEAMRDLLDKLRQITVASMAQHDVKSGSDLSKSVKYTITKKGIKMVAAEYYGWVSEGRDGTRRKPRLRRVPLDVLIEWIKEKGIQPRASNGRFQTVNQMAWAIQTKIYNKGINSSKPVKGKGYATPVAENVADYTADELADILAMEIADELVDMFEPITV